MQRRTFLKAASSLALATPLLYAEDPLPKSALMEASELAKLLTGAGQPPAIFSVAFPVLYRQKHIPNTKFAGPGSKPEGISALKQAVAVLPKDAQIVLYCGCCPMKQCPNIRPAYAALDALGYSNVRVLNLPTNFRTDWTEKGYPVEPPAAS